MSLGDKFKHLKVSVFDKLQERREYIGERKKIIKNLTMTHLKELEEDYDIYVYALVGEARRGDYITCIAKSKNISTEKLKKFVDRINKKEELELKSPEIKQIYQKIQGNQILKNSTLIGDVNIIQNIIKDWSLEIINSNIDFNLRKEAMQKIEKLKEEMSKSHIDPSIIDTICKWFSNNIKVLATLSAPFITKILSYL